MALIKCPECGLSISDKAAACPNCGYPLHPAPEPVGYELSSCASSESKGATFLRVVAWLVWCGGLIVAIGMGHVEKAVGTYRTEIVFDWGIFFTALCTYALYGGLIWSVSLLFEDVHNIYTSLSTLKLSNKNVPDNTSCSTENSAMVAAYSVVAATTISNVPINNRHLFTFGHYPQSSQNDSNSSITWQLLSKEGNKALYISQYVLDCQPYNTKNASVTWDNCSLCSWLNDEFYNRAFSAVEKQRIIKTWCDSAENPCNVFLPSAVEAKEYFKDDSSRICLPSNYATSFQSIHLNEQSSTPSACYWWLRSPETTNGFAATVCNDGYINPHGYEVDSTGIGVRPCIWVLLS